MAESYHRREHREHRERLSRTPVAAPASRAIAQTSGAPFWILAALLIVGLALGTYVAYQGLNGPQILTPEQADVAAGWALAATAIILLWFLALIGSVFGQIRRLTSQAEDRESLRRDELVQQQQVNERLMTMLAAMQQREHMLRSELARRRVLPRAAAPLDEEEPHVLTLEGVGPKYAARLNAIGIITTGQLRSADAANVAYRIDATPELVREWQTMAELLQVKGVGPQWAEALARIGVTSVADLAQRDPKQLAREIAQLNAGGSRVTGSDPSPATCARWVRSARGTAHRGARPAPVARSPGSEAAAAGPAMQATAQSQAAATPRRVTYVPLHGDGFVEEPARR